MAEGEEAGMSWKTGHFSQISARLLPIRCNALVGAALFQC